MVSMSMLRKMGAMAFGSVFVLAIEGGALKQRLRAAELSLEEGAQKGLQMPEKGTMDFGLAGPKALLAVEADASIQETAKAVSQAGMAQLALGADAASGSWSMRTGNAASRSDPKWMPVAWAAYNNTVKQNGWAYLSLKTTAEASVSKDVKMYAAGFLEGFVTARQIRDFSHNAGILLQGEEERHHALGNIQALFGRSLLNICNKSGMQPGSVLRDAEGGDPWWQHARFALVQAWGTLDGYNQRAKDVDGKPMSLVDLMVLNSDGETPELEQAYDMEESLLRQSQSGGSSDDAESFIQQQERHSTMLRGRAEKPQDFVQRFADKRKKAMQNLGEAAWRKIKLSGGRCSALVRLSKDNKDIFVGHATFSDYSEMNRIFKYYDFPLGEHAVQKMGFSSYPGVAGSTDDYYLLDSGLVITETTISMLTDEPYDKLQDNLTQVPDFMRIMVANRLARSGTHWAELMTQSATGTYSSQWMAVDYNKFTPGEHLQPGVLTVIEQIPGMSHTEDMSAHLQEKGFWASENRAWFKGVRDSMGANEAEELHGNLFSAEKSPRAHIFNATAPEVQTLAEMRTEMRRNRWPHEVDGGEDNTPDHAIAARGDLYADHPSANGAVDAKVTNRCLAKKLQAHAVSGPTADTQKPFRWNDEKTGKDLFPDMPKAGLPDLWNFGWVQMTPAGEMDSLDDNQC